MKTSEILLIDDESINLQALKNALSGHFGVKACKSGSSAFAMLQSGFMPDLILMDISMPDMDGYQTLELIYSIPEYREIPVIFVTALDSYMDEEKGFKLGAVDYITKPIRPSIVLERVKVHLELKAARDLLSVKNLWLEEEVNRRVSENQLIQEAALDVISQLVETRDYDTGNHISRTKLYVELLARNLAKTDKYKSYLSEERIQQIAKASVFHDIGKIGIPDMVLMKPSILSEAEYELMKTHCMVGVRAIQKALNKYLQVSSGNVADEKPSLIRFFDEAIGIIKSHHEKWDGTGYPVGLSGEEIPIAARIMMMADIFDALTSHRVYKAPWAFEEAEEWIIKNSGIFFDPEVVAAFISEKKVFRAILVEYQDEVSQDEPQETLWDYRRGAHGSK